MRKVTPVASTNTVKTWRRRLRTLARLRSREPMKRCPRWGMRTQRPADDQLFASANIVIFRSNSSTLDRGERRREGIRNAAQMMPKTASKSQLNNQPSLEVGPGSTTTCGLKSEPSTPYLVAQQALRLFSEEISGRAVEVDAIGVDWTFDSPRPCPRTSTSDAGR